jgi:hypothetical protein
MFLAAHSVARPLVPKLSLRSAAWIWSLIQNIAYGFLTVRGRISSKLQAIVRLFTFNLSPAAAHLLERLPRPAVVKRAR